MPQTPTATQLTELFHHCFEHSENTRLEPGAMEPYYVPADADASFSNGVVIQRDSHARIFARSDYPASVMHEVAHWCIAGKERRAVLDYGYWYEPDGRSAQQQQAFEQVEVKPQALEWILSLAAGMPFRLSADNASDPLCKPSGWFKQAVMEQAVRYVTEGIPARAERYACCLDQYYEQNKKYTNLCSYKGMDLL